MHRAENVSDGLITEQHPQRSVIGIHVTMATKTLTAQLTLAGSITALTGVICLTANGSGH